MPLFIITCIDKPNSLELRLATRPAHLEYMKDIKPNVRAGGPMLSDAGEMNGTTMIVEVADKETAAKIPAGDPYGAAGLFESVTIRQWNMVVGAFA